MKKHTIDEETEIYGPKTSDYDLVPNTETKTSVYATFLSHPELAHVYNLGDFLKQVHKIHPQ